MLRATSTSTMTASMFAESVHVASPYQQPQQQAIHAKQVQQKQYNALEDFHAATPPPLPTTLLPLSSTQDDSTTSRQLEVPLTSVIRPRLLPYVLQGGMEFDDPDSYQSKALDRVASQIGATTTMSDVKLVQYYVLYCILEATNGIPNVLTYTDYRFNDISREKFPTWIRTNGWTNVDDDGIVVDWDPCEGQLELVEEEVSDINETSPWDELDDLLGGNETTTSTTTTTTFRNGITWYGITCNDQSQVTELSLIKNLLTGSFPPEIKLLAGDGPFSTGAGNLNYLELYDNEFLFNNFDNSWMTDLGSNLEYLYVGFTGFAGHFPQLPVGIIEVDFSYTLVHNGLTERVFEFTPFVEYINLGGNGFNTTLPTTLTSSPNLKFLYVHKCLLRGTLDFVSTMPSIYELWIDVNPTLEGGIPDTIQNVTTLASLSFTANTLTGTIPSTLGTLTNLQQLWLYDNNFSGTIPSEIASLPLLKIFEVQGNLGLTGTMPTEICNNVQSFFGRLDDVGGDCGAEATTFTCSCCTCCNLNDCHPTLYPYTEAPTAAPRFMMP